MTRPATAPPVEEPHKHLSKRFRLFVLATILAVLLTILWLYLHPAWQTQINNYLSAGQQKTAAQISNAPLKTPVTADGLMPVVWDNLRSLVTSEIQNHYSATTTNYYLEGSYVRTIIADGGLTSMNSDDGLTTTLGVGAGDGIVVGENFVGVDLDSNGGLVFNNGQVSLATSCTDGELLKWDSVSADWHCAVDVDTVSGVPLAVGQADGAAIVNPTVGIEFGPTATSTNEFIVTDIGGGVARVRTGTAVPLTNSAQTITGAWTFTSQIVANGGISCADCIALGSETTGNYIAALTAGSGIAISGLAGEGTTQTIGLITSCSDGQLLKWVAGGSSWACAADIDTDTTGTPLTVQESDGSPLINPTTTLQFGPVSSSSDEFTVTSLGSGAVRVRTGAMVALINTVETITAGWTFNSSITASGGLGCTDCIALGAETTGNYLASVTAGNGIAITAAGGEADTPSVAMNLASGSGMSFTSGAVTLLPCSDGQILKRVAGAWACTSATLPTSVYKQQLAGTDNRTVGSSLTPLLTNGSGAAQSLGIILGNGNAVGFIATMQVASTLATGPVDYVVIRDDNHDNDCVTGGGDGTQVGGQVTGFVATIAQSFTTTISFVDTAPSATSYYQICASTTIGLGTASVTNRSLVLNELGL